MSQQEQLRAHLAKGKSISPAEAKEVYGIRRLAARVHELQDYGEIISQIMWDENGNKYARYKAADKRDFRL